MGDNVYLGDRNGVRTPMQWSADRNAGFSRANPQRLILPIIIDPEYHYEALNVEAQQNNPNSLLWWTKRLIALRKRYQAFGRGTIEFLTPANPRVLAFVRERDGTTREETVLVVANLSRFPQYVELDLSKWKGMRPLELFGHTEFPAIGELPYLLTLAGHDFYWFSLEPPPSGEGEEEAAAYVPPVLTRQERAQPARGRRTADDRGRAGRFPGDAALVQRSRSPRDVGPDRGGRVTGRRVRAGGAQSSTPIARPNATCCRWRSSPRPARGATRGRRASEVRPRARRPSSTRWKTAASARAVLAAVSRARAHRVSAA